MIQADFIKKDGLFSAVLVSGHAGYAGKGEDIVCAAVTSAVQLVSNGVTEIFKMPMDVSVGENDVALRLPANPPREAAGLLEALYLHLGILSGQYGGFIEITITEE